VSITLVVVLLVAVIVLCLMAIVTVLAWNGGASMEAVDATAVTAAVVPEPAYKNMGPVVRGPDGKSKVLSPAEVRQQQLEERMLHAGLYRKGSTSRFMVIQVVLALTPLSIAFVGVQLHWISLMQGLLFGVAPAISGIVGPGLWLDHKKARRQMAIRRALPDALDVIVVCLEAGLSMSAALVKVGKELRGAYPMLASEITIVHREVQMGNSTGEALLRFANRFDLDELRSLSLVVRQAEKFGASLASALRVHAETLRIKRLQYAQERAQKAAVKLLFPTVLFIFPALFVVILGPAAFDIHRTVTANAVHQSSHKSHK